jgi:hypothetical protein
VQLQRGSATHVQRRRQFTGGGAHCRGAAALNVEGIASRWITVELELNDVFEYRYHILSNLLDYSIELGDFLFLQGASNL